MAAPVITSLPSQGLQHCRLPGIYVVEISVVGSTFGAPVKARLNPLSSPACGCCDRGQGAASLSRRRLDRNSQDFLTVGVPRREAGTSRVCLSRPQRLPPDAGCTEGFDEGAVTPGLILPKFPTALFSALEEPGVPAVPKLLPVVPWLFALLAFASGAPPLPFTVAPLLSAVPDPDDVPPVDAPGEPPAELDPPAAPPADPSALPPPPPLLCAKAGMGDIRAATTSHLHMKE
jgi:hypothetical protein